MSKSLQFQSIIRDIEDIRVNVDIVDTVRIQFHNFFELGLCLTEV